MQFTVGELVGLLSAVFGMAAGILGLLLRFLIASHKEKTKQELESVASLARQELATVNESSRAQFMRIEVRVDQCYREIERLLVHVDKLRDKIRSISSEHTGTDPSLARRMDEVLFEIKKLKVQIGATR